MLNSIHLEYMYKGVRALHDVVPASGERLETSLWNIVLVGLSAVMKPLIDTPHSLETEDMLYILQSLPPC